MKSTLLLSVNPSSYYALHTIRFLPLSHRICFLRKSSSVERLLRAKQEGNIDRDDAYVGSPLQTRIASKGSNDVLQKLLVEMTPKGSPPDVSVLSAMILYYANNGLFSQAQTLWDDMFYSSFSPTLHMASELIDVYATSGRLDLVTRVIHHLSLKNKNMLPEIYSRALSSFGKKGDLALMDFILREMISAGFPVSSLTGNAFLIYYSNHGTLSQMEVAYARLKSLRILIEEEAIRAVSSAYIRERKFYNLGKFVEDVGLGRRNVGNLLWNLLLLSYAANFKMKSLQRTFVRMVESEFHPDLTTFNIRALAFSKMLLFWDLHLSLEHMQHEAVVPDLVTYGCIIDAYLERRLGRNLDFVLRNLNTHDSVQMLTDAKVFEVMGKGDFHLSADAFLEYSGNRSWTYKQLIGIYLKKKFRSNQVFWNY